MIMIMRIAMMVMVIMLMILVMKITEHQKNTMTFVCDVHLDPNNIQHST